MHTLSENEALARALLGAVHAQDFGNTADSLLGDKPVEAFPSIDLAVIAFARGGRARWANVLFSREHPRGVIGETGPRAKSLRHLRFVADQRDAKGDSVAWLPGADWRRLTWQPLHGDGPVRFVAPYPASLLKLMVAVGLALAVEAGRTSWDEIAPDLEPMITVSDNDATTRCVARLHRAGMVDAMNLQFATWGLPTLQVNDTTPAGGWLNGDGAGVGKIHMTAWDTARLLWLLDTEAPPAPWLAPDAPRLNADSCSRLRAVLAQQQLDEILSSGSLRDVPGWVPGLPDAPAFAHKTGTTQNYGADAGIVRTPRAHYVVAVLTNLGTRYAPHPDCATTWRLPALGAAVHRLMADVRA